MFIRLKKVTGCLLTEGVLLVNKEELFKEVIAVMKTMTPEERGKFIADITSISINLTIKESMSKEVREAFDKSESEVA